VKSRYWRCLRDLVPEQAPPRAPQARLGAFPHPSMHSTGWLDEEEEEEEEEQDELEEEPGMAEGGSHHATLAASGRRYAAGHAAGWVAGWDDADLGASVDIDGEYEDEGGDEDSEESAEGAEASAGVSESAGGEGYGGVAAAGTPRATEVGEGSGWASDGERGEADDEEEEEEEDLTTTTSGGSGGGAEEQMAEELEEEGEGTWGALSSKAAVPEDWREEGDERPRRGKGEATATSGPEASPSAKHHLFLPTPAARSMGVIPLSDPAPSLGLPLAQADAPVTLTVATTATRAALEADASPAQLQQQAERVEGEGAPPGDGVSRTPPDLSAAKGMSRAIKVVNAGPGGGAARGASGWVANRFWSGLGVKVLAMKRHHHALHEARGLKRSSHSDAAGDEEGVPLGGHAVLSHPTAAHQ
jgi:hypothetical protein